MGRARRPPSRHRIQDFSPLRRGELTLAFEGLEMAAEPGLTLTIYTAEPGSPSAERMQLLASLAASENADSAPHVSERSLTDG
ncbi:putative MmyB family DNA-binding protein [Rhodococcus erythropolis PR4]|uniref:Putative MmyB family DNA-binding protein n=1 Tax=Rhodococcus erythropolis (strain PR4 / NBRC 100887) TaxID=234621 RepID=C0ZU70_RHOE4|nr:putative MmyB family DNA-binding protein [Rhodococcus erythropolis PR4]